MALNIRPATLADLDTLVQLAAADAHARADREGGLWQLKPAPEQAVRDAWTGPLSSDGGALRHRWFLAEVEGRAVGMVHTILLPVPPIYAGRFGPPGLIMEDSMVLKDAPDETHGRLIATAEADLREAGARYLICSSASEDETPWTQAGYSPLTHYFAKVGLNATTGAERKAVETDIPAIVRLSAQNRDILNTLNSFWEPHLQADQRFGAWMSKSLTLQDRDMRICSDEGGMTGYVISQPATPLHFPPPHDIARIGVLDDWFETYFADPTQLESSAASPLLAQAEADLHARGCDAALVVCPAAWHSKIAVLRLAGYHRAITWYLKQV